VVLQGDDFGVGLADCQLFEIQFFVAEVDIGKLAYATHLKNSLVAFVCFFESKDGGGYDDFGFGRGEENFEFFLGSRRHGH